MKISFNRVVLTFNQKTFFWCYWAINNDCVFNMKTTFFFLKDFTSKLLFGIDSRDVISRLQCRRINYFESGCKQFYLFYFYKKYNYISTVVVNLISKSTAVLKIFCKWRMSSSKNLMKLHEIIEVGQQKILMYLLKLHDYHKGVVGGLQCKYKSKMKVK